MQILTTVPSFKSIIDQYKNLECLLFDMDGTLFNTEPHHAKALKKLLHDIHFNQKLDWDELEKHYKGWSDVQIFQELLKFQSLDVTLTDFLNKKNQAIIKIFKASPPQMQPQAKQLIKKAREKKLKLGLVTSSERLITLELLKTDIELFDLVITREDTQKNKPDPAPYLLALKKLNSQPEQTIIFEDSPAGLTSAQGSKAHVMKVEWFD